MFRPITAGSELACELLNAEPLNCAVGGESVSSSANRMNEGKLYSREELERIDAFVIMQVHNRDVILRMRCAVFYCSDPDSVVFVWFIN